ncbi:MAG TPA: hypothetical protein PLH92_07800 [Mycobacterium sp.]|mgnify:CR=1 FL=1|nr:hypothetical protein [Mycobacterium sp.]HQC76608.1 hypothetical protein [Mycobacterium sp.]
MNAGEEVLDFLYTTQHQVDDEWAVKTPNGFTWWAGPFAQHVEIIGEETSPDGQTGYLIRIRTEMVSGVELTDELLAELNEGPMQFASMAGPVYDPETQMVSMCTLVRVHDGIVSWMKMLLSTAAILQLAEAQLFAEEFAANHGGQPAISSHPDSGLREDPDEMMYAAARIFSEDNREPFRLQEKDFDDLVEKYMMQPPSVGASAGGLGLAVEFPYGDESSLCQFFGDENHPLYGNGLLIVQRFPHRSPSVSDGIRLALELNREDLTEHPTGYGFGSYVYVDDMLCFNGFIPNLLLRDVVAPSLYFSCASRARAMSVRLTGQDWDENSFSLDRSALGRAVLAGEDEH